ncbi:MAG TPA: hypothetical protein VH913_15515 [Hyphomicrobiaceae bacterium]|jgi:hypothetical protein
MMRIMAMAAAVLLSAAALSLTARAPRAADSVNDYPTATRADYVFACMQVNGQTPEALAKCSCSIDVIASLLPYDKYEEAETIMRVRQRAGEKAEIFRTNPTLRGEVDDLRRAQVEGELRCF